MVFLFLTALPNYLRAEAEATQDIDYFPDFLRMIVSLVFVIILILATTWFIKKFAKSRLRHMNQSNVIKIIERRVLHQKASLYLIDILGKGIVIAESNHGIHLITEFSADMNVEELANKIEISEKKNLNFSDILQKIKKKVPIKEN